MTPRRAIYQQCHAKFVPGVIRFAYALGAVILVSTASATAASVSNPSNRPTLLSYSEKGTSGEDMFSIHSVELQPERADDQVDVRRFGVTGPNFDWFPKHDQKARRGFAQNGHSGNHKTKHHDDDGALFFDQGGDFVFQEDKEGCRFCGKDIDVGGRPCDTAPVPLPGAAWLFGTGLLGLSVIMRLKHGAVDGRSHG